MKKYFIEIDYKRTENILKKCIFLYICMYVYSYKRRTKGEEKYRYVYQYASLEITCL